MINIAPSIGYHCINPFWANVPILHPLKTPENLWFSGVFRGCRMGTLVRNGLSFITLAKSEQKFPLKCAEKT